MKRVFDLATIVIVGIIIATLASNANTGGTGTLLCGVTYFWQAAVNGMLGQQVPNYNCGQVAAQATGPKAPGAQQKPAPKPTPKPTPPKTQCFLFGIKVPCLF